MLIDDEGALHASDLWVPFSTLASEAARDVFVGQTRAVTQAADLGAELDDVGLERHVLDMRAGADLTRKRIAEEMIDDFDVVTSRGDIAGIPVDVVEPRAGVVDGNQDRVLVNLHGGGMVFGARWEGLLASIPIAARLGIQVVTVDYRMAPEHRFPAASEDVAAVYRELVRTYAPGAIGIYGVSAGGWLTSWSVAWFDAHEIPLPGAIGVIAAGFTDRCKGDSAYVAGLLAGGAPVLPGTEAMRYRAVQLYTSEADRSDPLVDPLSSPALAARFPPTLVLNSGRDSLLSGALHGHLALVRAGVEAELYVWDGMWHAFLYDSVLPESQQAYDVIAGFFDRWLV